jgi:putative ABC transport system permease protein
MKTLRGWLMRIAGIFSRNSREQQFAVEMESNLQMHIEDNLRAGMNLDEARRQALVKFGGFNSARDDYRRQGGLPFLETLLQDLRYGTRTLRKSPGFTLVAVLTLALGIGANTAIFSVINAVLLKPLPFKDPDRLVQLWETEPAPGNFPLTGPDYLDWQAQNTTLESSALYGWPRSFNASSAGEAQPVLAISTQANFFSVLGVGPAMGRTFAPAEDQSGKNKVAVISNGFWKKYFATRADVIGQTIELNSEPHVVVGVMPEWFNFPTRTEIWMPQDMAEKALGPRGSHGYSAVGRVKSTSSIAAARADLLAISKRIEERFHNPGIEAVVVPLKEQLTGDSRPQLLLLLAAVAAVLLVACVNVANLLLARATGRQREIALRAVLGASRRRVVRQLLTESVLLSLLGAALGLGGAWWAVAMIRSSNALPIPRVNAVNLDLTVLAFTVFVSMFVGLLFGLAPALQATGVDLSEELKASAQSVVSPLGWRRLLRDGLVIVEISASVALLAGAGLLLRSFSNKRNADVGVQAQNLMTLTVVLPAARYATPASVRGFIDQYLERAQHAPGVVAASISTELPLEGGNNGYVKIDGDKDPAHGNRLVEFNNITPDYFRAMGIPMVRGENFSAAEVERVNQVNLEIDELVKKNPDIKDLPPELSVIAVINQTMAKTFWPNQDAVGKVFHSGVPVRVIGVVGDSSVFGIQKKPFPEAYFPYTAAVDRPGFAAHIAVRTSGAPMSILPTLRSQLKELDSSLAVFEPRTMEQVIAEATQDTGTMTYLLGSFAGLALILAAIGLYSVLAYLVTQRMREIGIRMALGAQQRDVLRLVMVHGSKLTVAGLLLGGASALALTRFLKTMLFGVDAKDPVTFAGVMALLAAVAMAACFVPALRAARVEPMVALRDE